MLVKIATGTSYEAAEACLHAEQPGWDFDAVHRQAEEAWAKKLNAIEVKGGTEKQRRLFYSCLYHSLYGPHLLARMGEEFTDRKGVVERAAYDRYDEVPLWDTGRNQIVLLTLIEPDTKTDILRSELDDARERGYMETSFHGDNAVFIYLGDWERGLTFDWLGQVQGNCQVSDRLEIRSEGSWSGDVIVSRISIADGAVVKGNIDIRRLEV